MRKCTTMMICCETYTRQSTTFRLGRHIHSTVSLSHTTMYVCTKLCNKFHLHSTNWKKEWIQKTSKSVAPFNLSLVAICCLQLIQFITMQVELQFQFQFSHTFICTALLFHTIGARPTPSIHISCNVFFRALLHLWVHKAAEFSRDRITTKSSKNKFLFISLVTWLSRHTQNNNRKLLISRWRQDIAVEWRQSHSMEFFLI